MSKTFLQFALAFVLLVIVQSVVFNRLVLFSAALAFVFIYFIIKLPVTIGASRVIFLSFLLGLCVDIFSDTPGLNALSCTISGGCRHTILRLYVAREDDMIHKIPSIRSLGAAIFSKYAFTMSLLYCLTVTLVEAFSFFQPLVLVERIAASTLLTSVLIIGIDFISSRSQISPST